MSVSLKFIQGLHRNTRGLTTINTVEMLKQVQHDAGLRAANPRHSSFRLESKDHSTPVAAVTLNLFQGLHRNKF